MSDHDGADDGAAAAAASDAEYGPLLPFTMEQLEVCQHVLQQLHAHPSLWEASLARPVRKAVHPLFQRFQANMYHGMGTKRFLEKEATGEARRRVKQKMESLDRKASELCRLRADRMRRHKELTEQQETQDLPLLADGAVDVEMPSGVTTAATGDDPMRPEMPSLATFRRCYICKTTYKQLHHFYHALCPKCGDFNFHKRQQSASMTGRVALVTGARVKVGFHTAIKLLQAGATVLATSRFPKDAADRYARHPDYASFQDRLQIFGIDLRDIAHLHAFLDFVQKKYARLDVIIHNASQTVRRPRVFYQHLLQKELEAASDPSAARLLQDQTLFDTTLQPRQELQTLTSQSPALPSTAVVSASHTLATLVQDAPSASLSVLPSALKSQIALTVEDTCADPALFPQGKTDLNGQQVDLRTKNSWVLRLGEIDTPEVAEVFMINAMAPFIINNHLLPLLEASPARETFIINVSAMEGKFYRVKKPNHPHTNMAKAAVNMMTRTCGHDLAQRGIFMNSVDTGWVSDEKPLPAAHATATKYGFQPPLDEIDAAARILDPIFTAVQGAPPRFGQFLKDFDESEW